ncbi:MAG TPA: nucleoside triphosphate pyrophosphohydrolase [Candidatus Ozemobacteraceae bacterium]
MMTSYPFFDEAPVQFRRLLEIMARLRAPDGCSWDRKQDHKSLRKYVLEEANEVAEAIDKGDPLHLAEELGDLAMMIAFHAQVAAEAGTFTMTEVMKGICEKLISRHPHVFASADGKTLTPDQVVDMWGRLKTDEKARRARISSRMQEAVAFASPMKSAFQIQAEAATVGFDFPEPRGAVDKIAEEAKELAGTLADEDAEAASEELGDLLFAIINAARLMGVDPEAALRQATAKFVRRFERVEERAEAAGGFAGRTIEEMDGWWNEAKRLEKVGS